MEFNSSIFFWTLISFAIVVYVLYRYVFPPIIKFLDDREAMQQKFQQQLEADKLAAENLRIAYEKKLETLGHDIETRLKSLEKELEAQRKEAFDKIELDKKSTLAELEKEIETAKLDSIHEMNERIEEIVFLAMSKIVQKKLSVTDHEMIIDDCIKELEIKFAEEL